MRWCIRRSSNDRMNGCSEISWSRSGTFHVTRCWCPDQNEEDIMKKLGFIIAALGTIAIAAPSIASAEEMMIRHDHDRMNARADMHRDHGWHHHHHDRMMMRHRHHG
jgi:hypothetical protein